MTDTSPSYLRLRNALTASASLLLVSPVTAYAYIDPGSGSFILQMVGAAAVGAVFYFRVGLDAIKRFIARLLGK